MRIQLTSKSGVTTKEGKFKPYQEIDIEFQDLDDGRAKKKHLVSFNFKSFDKIVEAGIGSSWQVNTTPSKKDPQYVDWIDATPITVEARGEGSNGSANDPAKYTPGEVHKPYKSTYETPEERAKKQVYIVRQSSIGHAIAYCELTKQSLSAFQICDVAKVFEAYVFGVQKPEQNSTIPTVE